MDENQKQRYDLTLERSKEQKRFLSSANGKLEIYRDACTANLYKNRQPMMNRQ